ncbi:DMT family transporter [Dethiobacter alkaliphilus]|uniref:DMT family transporter n=1 Tax=Dethiobacter alkaliphilus TaxID=427926 RepID=UPI0022268FE9|nr:DMT family transporter [Dethiobacter alkaliphilus]MCW3489837.1 DMT family transporter [Dethiobacter alkaliphilus]
MDKEKVLPVGAGILVSVFFGLSFMFTREALDVLAPLQLLGFRFALAALAMTLLRAAGWIKINLRGKNLRAVLLVALLQPFLYFIFETTGVRLTSASEAGMMMGLIPVMTVILEIPFFKTVPSFKQLAAVIMSVSGVFFIVLMQGSVDLSYNIWGTLALLGAVVCAGLYNIYSKKSSQAFTPLEITYIMMWAGALLFNGIELVRHTLSGTLWSMLTPLADPAVLSAVLYLGMLSSVVAFFLLNYMLSKVRASQTSAYLNLTTVVAILGGVLFRGESFAWFQGVGAVMIMSGVWGTSYFGRQKSTTPLPVKLSGHR